MKIVDMPGPENISIEWNGNIYLLYGAYEHGCLTVMPEHLVREDRSEMSEKEKAVFMQEAYRKFHFVPPYRLDFEVPFNWKGELLFSEENGTIIYKPVRCTCELLDDIEEFSSKDEFDMAADMIERAVSYGKFRKKIFSEYIKGKKASKYRCEICGGSWYVVRPDSNVFNGSVTRR